MGMPYDLIWLCVPGYIILQTMLLTIPAERPRGAMLPLVVMSAVLVITAFLFATGSNLWPLYLLFTAPLAFLYVAGLSLTADWRGRSSG